MQDYRTFIVEVTDFDGKLVGSLTLEGMSKDNNFINIINHACWACCGGNKVKHEKEDEDFTVSVYKLDTLGRKRFVNDMDVCCEGDSTFAEIIELAYHGCTDN